MRFWSIILFLAFCPSVFAQNTPLAGNPRDPLNAHFGEAGVPAQSPYAEIPGDTRLNDVCFVNPQRGWAVGDHGVILSTADGGVNWHVQETPIDCILRGVQFFDESFGIAVGNYWFPPTQQGRGVILTTRNGGQDWQLRHTPELPPLYRVKMFDETNILIAGATSERTPGGLLMSRDGGQNWRSIASDLSDGFIAADFYEPRQGIGIGFHGILQQFQNRITASQTATFGNRQVSAVKVNRATAELNITGWAVGDRGTILSSVDQGFRWGVVPGTLPGSASEVVDLKTIETRGKNLWVAGNPGTCIYMSSDAGQTWQRILTGAAATIRKIVFVDNAHGWAVGDLGTILTTQNGGQTWYVQQTGGSKLSVLGLFGETESIPFEAFAALSANQGYLSGCVLLFRNEKNSGEQENRFHESMIRVGGSFGAELGTFPILPRELWTTPEKLVEHIQKATDGKGIAQLREQLVIALRQWKPEILLTSNYTNPYTDSAADGLALREIMEAVKLAGDFSAYPHHLTELGLSAWNVKKVYLTLKNNTPGDVNLTPSEPTVQLGTPLEEMTYISRSLMGTKRCPPILGFLNVSPDLPDSISAASKDFFSGIPIVHGSDGRRSHSGVFVDIQSEHRHRALQRRNVLGILQNTARTTQESGIPVNRANLVAHAADLTWKLDPDSAVQILLEMAEQFHQDGDWYAATETYLILTRQYAQHPLVRQAFVRLMYYAASGEIFAGEQQKNMIVTTEEEWVADPRRPEQRILQASTTRETLQGQGQSQKDTPSDRVLLLGQFLEQNFIDLADDVSMRFAVTSALRKGGWEQDAARFYQTRGNMRFDDIWGMRARTEYWLTMPDKSELPVEQQELPMPALVCAYTGIKPFLDGKFDAEKDQNVWQRSQVYSLTPEKPRKRLEEMLQDNAANRVGLVREERLRSMSQNFGTQLMFLHDAEYWYIALRCPKVPGFVYPPVAGRQRLRDAAMADQDRLEILIDMDRDYKTYYSLTIDSRGWVTDACCGDRNWDPQWHVARHEDSEAWYIEAAIPFSAFAPRPLLPHTVWSVAVRRLVPGEGIECWNAENSFDLTEGFGLIFFP